MVNIRSCLAVYRQLLREILCFSYPIKTAVRCRRHSPVRALRAGVGFGTPVHAVKCLQIALSGYNPGESASEEGLVEGYDLPFNIKPPVKPLVRQPHPLLGKCAGLYLSPDGPHESNHSEECKSLFGGLKTCRELASVNLNPHERNHSKKKTFLRSLNVMGCDSFAFMVTLVNELENQAINVMVFDLSET